METVEQLKAALAEKDETIAVLKVNNDSLMKRCENYMDAKARIAELESTVQSIREWASDCEILGEVAPDVFAGNLRIDHEALLSFYNILNEQPKENPDAN